MTISPNVENCVAVSTTASPVTQVAVVAVKREDMKSRPFPSSEAIGRDKRTAPTIISARNPRTIACDGFIFTALSFFRNTFAISISVKPSIPHLVKRLLESDIQAFLKQKLTLAETKVTLALGHCFVKLRR